MLAKEDVDSAVKDESARENRDGSKWWTSRRGNEMQNLPKRHRHRVRLRHHCHRDLEMDRRTTHKEEKELCLTVPRRRIVWNKQAAAAAVACSGAVYIA